MGSAGKTVATFAVGSDKVRTAVLQCVASSHHPLFFKIPQRTAAAGGAIRLPHAGVNAVAVRQDRRIAATGGWDGNVRVFHWRKRTPLAVVPAHAGSVHTLAFCGVDTTGVVGVNGLLASGGKDGNVVVHSLYPPRAADG